MPKPSKEKTKKDDSKTYHLSVKADLDKLKNNTEVFGCLAYSSEHRKAYI